MKKTEQQLADELEQTIAAVMQGKTMSPADKTQANEARLAADLVHLAARTNPDPSFVAQLQRRLSARAIQLKKTEQSPERASFWQDLTQMLKEGFTMKRTYALGTLIALIVFVGSYGLWRTLSPGSDPGQVAEVAPIPADTLPDENNTVSGQPLAQLPRFQTQNPAGGMGGGDASEAAAPMSVEGDFDMKMMDPFSGTTFILNGTLPSEPTSGLVHQRQPEVALDIATVRQIADQYGFTGPIYVETYSSDVPSDQPPPVYIVFDGPRNLRLDSWSINYTDEGAAARMNYDNPTLRPETVGIAEAFLTQHGQLNFPYVAEAQLGDSVLFYRLVDGRKVNEPEISVTVNQDNEVVYVFDNTSTDWAAVGSYPLITAEQAWQQVQAGVFENSIQYQMMPADLGEPLPIEEPDFLADYKYWPRDFVPGSEVHLYEWPIVYQPVDGGDPLVKVRTFTVIADAATLSALVDGRDSQLHLWGTLNENRTQLQLAGWEPLGEYNPIYQQGVVRRQDEQLLFYGQEGDIYILPNAPADIENGLEVNVFGYAARDTGLEYPVLDWESIDKYIEYPEPELSEESHTTDDMPIEPFVPFRYSEVQINGAELVYYLTYAFPEMQEGEDPMWRPAPTIYLQPAWAFSGTADNGDEIKLFVQAVANEYLQP